MRGVCRESGWVMVREGGEEVVRDGGEMEVRGEAGGDERPGWRCRSGV